VRNHTSDLAFGQELTEFPHGGAGDFRLPPLIRGFGEDLDRGGTDRSTSTRGGVNTSLGRHMGAQQLVAVSISWSHARAVLPDPWV